MSGKIRTVYLFLALFTVCLLVAAALQTQAGTAAAEEETAYLYELREYGGRIALFADAGNAPLHVFDRGTADLPDADRAALARGIPVRDTEELRRLLEDYF